MMTVAPGADPVEVFEHSHDRLTRLAFEVSKRVRSPSPDERPLLHACVQALCDGLMEHFAAEEEGLYPFVRAHVQSLAPIVDELEEGHTVLCGTLMRLSHLAHGKGAGEGAALAAAFERFEAAYAQHSQGEAELLARLGRALDARRRKELGALLRGL